MTRQHLSLRLALFTAPLFAAFAGCSDGKENTGPGGVGGAAISGGASGGSGKGGAAGRVAGGSGGAQAGSGAGATGGSGTGGASAGSGGTGQAGRASGGSAGAGGAAGTGAGTAGATAGTSAGGSSGSGQSGASGADAGQSGSGGAGTGGTGGAGGSGTGVDVFGITELYPSAPSGAAWTSEHWDGDAYEIDEREDPNDPSGLSGFRGTGTLEVTGDGELVMGGSQPRIYIYPGDAGPWQDLEITAYYQRVTDSDTAYAGLVIGVRSGENGHSTGTECDAHTYYARVRNDGAFDFEKELKHPASATQSRVDPDDAWPDGEVPRSTWIGFKFVIYNVGSTVKFEAYRDMTNGEDGGDWELVNETIDDGGWSVETDCDEHDPTGGESDMIVLEGGTVLIRNTDVTEARYRWVTMREIAPG